MRLQGAGVVGIVVVTLPLFTSSALAAGRRMETSMQRSVQPRQTDTATFAAGCFWGVEALFRQVKGVTSTTVGYTGGTVKNPTYEQVCQHHTGHAEAVQVEYDPSQVSYDALLDVFWSNHDPTTPNRQGPDSGSQYRSAIFYHTPEQRAAAEAFKQRLEARRQFARPIVTQIVPATDFYRAEEYHQRYVEKHGGAQCHIPVKRSTPDPAK